MGTPNTAVLHAEIRRLQMAQARYVELFEGMAALVMALEARLDKLDGGPAASNGKAEPDLTGASVDPHDA